MFNLLRRSDLAVDLGTSKIAVYIRGEGLLFEEPACIALRKDASGHQGVVATGFDAVNMCGKTPPGTVIVKPIQDGVVIDSKLAGLLLSSLLRKHRLAMGPFKRRFLVASPYGTTSRERRSFVHVATAAGAGQVALVAEPLAAAIGAGLPIEEPSTNMVVDIGGGASEVMAVSLKHVASAGSIRVGGDTMNQAIVQMIHRCIGLDIGLQEARRLKEAVAAPCPDATPLEARGLDVRERRPRLAKVTAGEIRSALLVPLKRIIEMVEKAVQALPAELAADLIEQGITLTGGGAAMADLRCRLQEATQVPVKAVEKPQQAVIVGCGRMLDYYDAWQGASGFPSQ